MEKIPAGAESLASAALPSARLDPVSPLIPSAAARTEADHIAATQPVSETRAMMNYDYAGIAR